MIILIDKPSGLTSFDVIRRLRKKLGVRKMGHAGTLDPLATGLMIVGVGEGTKKLTEYLKLSKVYEAEILLGIKTDTGDIEGNVVEKRKIPDLNISDIEKTVLSMIGKIDLKVPLYSAIKRGGKPLYKYARSWEGVEIPVKTMQVNTAELLSFDGSVIKVKFGVGSGTYIRSLAGEISSRLGTVGTLRALRRLSIGDFRVEEAEVI